MNKEFWNRLQRDYPRTVPVLLKWVGEYKRANDWDELFDNPHRWRGAAKKNTIYFTDLPDAMQVGIFIEYAGTTSSHFPRSEGRHHIREWIEEVESWFAEVEVEMMNKKVKS